MSVFELDPQSLRMRADRHEEAAERTRRWARKPDEWLSTFISKYGKIAQPVYVSLERHYSARERVGNRMADQHLRTARLLREAADSFEHNDSDGSRQVSEAGSRVGDSAGSGAPPLHSPGPAEPNEAVPPIPGHHSMASGHDWGAPVALCGRGDGAQAVSTGPGPAMPVDSGGRTNSWSSPTAPVDGPRGRSPNGGSGGDEPVESGPAAVGSAPPPLPNPIARAIRAARTRATTEHEQVDDDLLVARSVLATVLAATTTMVNTVDWGVAVLRGVSGAGIFITTGEGRGWLPPGLFLPCEISTPWQWDELLGTDVGGSSGRWEQMADPVRILVEFAGVWGPKMDARLTALATSGPIAPDIRARTTAVAMEEKVTAGASADLSIPVSGMVDRLSLAGSLDALARVASVPSAERAARCLELALEACHRVRRCGPTSPEFAPTVRVRDRITGLIEDGRQPSEQLWGELRDTLMQATTSQPAGGVSSDTFAAPKMPGEVTGRVQRWCTELVLLLEGQPGYQRLRDAVFIHERIMKFAPARSDLTGLIDVAGPNERAAGPVDVQWSYETDVKSSASMNRSVAPVDSVHRRT